MNGEDYPPCDAMNGEADPPDDSEDINVLRGAFSLYDTDNSGYIFKRDLGSLLEKVGRKQSLTTSTGTKPLGWVEKEATQQPQQYIYSGEEVHENTNNNEHDCNSKISFQTLVKIVEREGELLLDRVDPKAIVLLRSLSQHCSKCEREGNFLDAARTKEQLFILKTQEENRLLHIVHQRHNEERIKLELVHNQQYASFCYEWNIFLSNFDEKARQYLSEMTLSHAKNLELLQQALEKQVKLKPPKWSRELMEWRKRQNVLVGQRCYLEAQQVKDVSDALEKEERGVIRDANCNVLAKREATLRKQQFIEKQNSLKRIEMRRLEHNGKKRNTDCNRLLQRNINIQNTMKSRHNAECNKVLATIKEKIRLALLGTNQTGNLC
jgi:hypothetical protein